MKVLTWLAITLWAIVVVFIGQIVFNVFLAFWAKKNPDKVMEMNQFAS